MDTYTVDGRTYTTGRSLGVFLEPGVHTLEIITPNIRADGRHKLRVTEAYKGSDYTRPGVLPMEIVSFRLRKATLRVLPGGVLPPEYQQVTINNPNRYTYTPAPEQVTFVDTPLNKNYAQIHRNYIAVNGQHSRAWHIKGAPLPEAGQADSTLIALLAANVAYNYTRPTHRLSGTLRGPLSYQQTVKERWDKNRLFILDGCRENVRFGTHEVTMHELVIPMLTTGNPAIDSGLALLTEDKAFFLVTEDNQQILMSEDIIE
jgi:hypothetical protein